MATFAKVGTVSGEALVVGEWGGRYTDVVGDDSDVLWQEAFHTFLLEEGLWGECGGRGTYQRSSAPLIF